MGEEDIKKIINDKLIADGFVTEVAWGHQHGVDICAKRGDRQLLIEVKGPGSRPQMRVNYFLSILGEILQRMDTEDAEYYIALPDMEVYRNLWKRLPDLAKQRTQIQLMLVAADGSITIIS